VLKFGYIIDYKYMKYLPSFTIYKKYFKIRNYKTIYTMKPLSFGFFGVKALESAFLSNFFIERLHLFLKRKMKKRGKVWFRVIPFIGVTKKPLEVRMGKGKGPHEYWVYHVKKAQVFMELTISDTFLLKRTLRALQMKLPLKVKFIINKL